MTPRLKRGVIIAGLVAAAAAVAFFSLRGKGVAVDVARAEQRLVREFISEDGETRLADEYIIDMPISGTLERITWDVGDEIKEGELLAQIDPAPLEQQVRELQALITQARARIEGVDIAKPKPQDLASAEVRADEARDRMAIAAKERSIAEINFDEARKQYERMRALLNEGAVSQTRFDEAQRQYRALQESLESAKLAEEAAQKALDIAQLSAERTIGSVDDNEYMRAVYQAEIDRLESQLALIRNDLEKASIEAPVSGPILEKFIEARRVLVAGTPILRMGDFDSIEIESDILSEEVGRVDVGDPVEISGKAVDNKIVQGTVKRVYPSGFKKISALGIEQQRVKVLIDFDNSEAQLRPGTSIDVRIITAEQEDTLAVPERATFRMSDDWNVFCIEDGRAVLTPVEIGLRNDEWAEITRGLDAGALIVAEPKNDLEDGVRVEALN